MKQGAEIPKTKLPTECVPSHNFHFKLFFVHLLSTYCALETVLLAGDMAEIETIPSIGF